MFCDTRPASVWPIRLLDLIAPPRCLACARPGQDLCAACRRTLAFLAEPRCPRCALPEPCGRRCPARFHAFDAAFAPVAHEGPARELVFALKFRTNRKAAELMAAQILAAIPPHLLAEDPTIVPVPGQPRRVRRRGYDHGRVLARALARRSGLDRANTLHRTAKATRQLGAGRSERLSANLGLLVSGKPPISVLLVDDVHTTGATLDACAQALRAAGTRKIVAVTYSRTLRRC